MKSLEHAVVGAVVGAVAVVFLFPTNGHPIQVALWTGGVFFSVFIDLDHFVIARAMSGDWSSLRRAVTNPRVGLVDQEQVFVDVDEPRLRQYRLLSHLLIGGVLVALASRLVVRLDVFVAVLLYAHVVADLLRDAELA